MVASGMKRIEAYFFVTRSGREPYASGYLIWIGPIVVRSDET
jgi:hypothetical protein